MAPEAKKTEADWRAQEAAEARTRDEAISGLKATLTNLNIAKRVLETTTNPDLLEAHATEYVKARLAHDAAVENFSTVFHVFEQIIEEAMEEAEANA